MIIQKKYITKFTQPLLYLLGNLSLKALPIIFGLIVSRVFSPSSYSHFVDLLVTGNLLVSFGVMGFGSQLLINHLTITEKFKILLNCCFIFPIILFTYVIFSVCKNEFLQEALLVVIYSITFGLSMLFISFMNGLQKFKLINTLISLNSLLIIIGCLILYLLNINYTGYLLLYCSAMIITVFFSIKSIFKERLISKTDFIRACSIDFVILKNALKLCAFGSVFLIGFKYVFSIVEINSQYFPIFSLSYQMFIVITFLPSIFGGFIIPKITSNTIKKSKNKYLLLFYISIAVLLSLTIGFFMNFILTTYKILYLADNHYIFYSMLFTAIIAATAIYFVQILNAQMKYTQLFISSIIWLIALTSSIYLINAYSVLNIIISLVIAYIFYLLALLVCYLKL